MGWCNDEEEKPLDFMSELIVYHFLLFLMLCVFFATFYYFFRNDSIPKKLKYSVLFSEFVGLLWIGSEALSTWTVQIYGLAFSSSFCAVRIFIISVLPAFYYNSIFLVLFFRLKQTFKGSSLRISKKQTNLFYSAFIICLVYSASLWAYICTLGCQQRVKDAYFEKYIPQGVRTFSTRTVHSVYRTPFKTKGEESLAICFLPDDSFRIQLIGVVIGSIYVVSMQIIFLRWFLNKLESVASHTSDIAGKVHFTP